MKSLDSFLTRVMPHVIGCPDVTAKEVMVDAAIDFCEKTLILRQTLDHLDTEAGVLEYDLSSMNQNSQESVFCPMQVWFKGCLLEPVSADLIANVQAFSTDVTGNTITQSAPTQYFWTAPSTLGLYPIPDVSELKTITVRAAVRPKRTATTLNDVLYDDWVEAIAAGTLARLHAMKDQPWASSDRSQIQRRYFHECIQRARVESSSGRVRGSMSVRMRSF